MDFRFSEDFIKVLEYSRDEALRTGWHNICPDHIMLGILRHADNGACRALQALGVDTAVLKGEIDGAVFVSEQVPWEAREIVNLSRSASSLLKASVMESSKCRSNYVEPLHFLLALTHVWGSFCHDWMEEHGIVPDAILGASGIDKEHYGVVSPSQNEAAAPDPMVLAAAIEQRLREGYSTDNPIVS